MRYSLVSAILSVLVSACTPAPAGEQASRQGEGQGAKIMEQPSMREKVKQWAGQATVSPYDNVTVAGIQLFTISPPPPAGVTTHDATPPRRGVAVQRNGDILEGKPAMQAVMDAGVSEPEAIARLALLFLHDTGELVTGGEGVVPPGYQGRMFVYYWRTSDMGRQLMKSQLDVAKLAVTTEPGVEELDLIEQARATLASDSEITWRTAIGQLKTLCAEPQALELLLETARTHTHTATRADAAEAVGACGSSDAIAPLANVLTNDPNEQVRAAAASGLGAIGGERAATALRAAQSSAQGDAVRRAIAFALKKIERPAP